MDAERVVIDRGKALELYQEYKKHLHYSQPIDRECMQAYHLLSKGRLIIKALESIKLAGLNAQEMPKLAIARATATSVHCSMSDGGSATMDSRDCRTSKWRRSDDDWVTERSYFQFPRGSFPRRKHAMRGIALVPGVPLNLRPRRGLENYHILWEAEWSKVVPHDPMLLRRIGRGDLWLVVAHWDLTEVERAALSTRL